MRGLEHFDDLIDQYEPLTHEEEALLAKMRDEGDEGAVEQLVLHNMRDLLRKVEKWNWQDESEIHDLFMHAMEGMRKAALRWTPMHDKTKYKKPARFMHYSYWYVKDEINRFCKKFGKPMVSLDAPMAGAEDGSKHELITGEVAEDSHDFIELSVLEELTKTQKEIFMTKFLYRYENSDADLAWACRIKEENVNKHLMKAILKIIELTGYGQERMA